MGLQRDMLCFPKHVGHNHSLVRAGCQLHVMVHPKSSLLKVRRCGCRYREYREYADTGVQTAWDTLSAVIADLRNPPSTDKNGMLVELRKMSTKVLTCVFTSLVCRC